MDGRLGGWVAGFCETITSSASAKAEIEVRAELGNTNEKLGGAILKSLSFGTG